MKCQVVVRSLPGRWEWTHTLDRGSGSYKRATLVVSEAEMLLLSSGELLAKVEDWTEAACREQSGYPINPDHTYTVPILPLERAE